MNDISICGRRVIIDTFAEGRRVRPLLPKPRTSENDILAHALWLERHRSQEAADEFLEKWCVANHPATRN